jgi:hypothetical protein
MTPKAIITLVVGILALGITTWKGPSAWSAVSTGIVAIALFVGTLKIIPKQDEEYVQDLEDALQMSVGNKSPIATNEIVTNLPKASRKRFLARISK